MIAAQRSDAYVRPMRKLECFSRGRKGSLNPLVSSLAPTFGLKCVHLIAAVLDVATEDLIAKLTELNTFAKTSAIALAQVLQNHS